MKTKVLFLFIILVVSVFSLYMLYSNNNQQEIKIGFVAGLSGKYSELGTEERNGFLLAVEQINAKNGIGSKKIVYEMKDDEQDKGKVLKAFGELIKNDYKIIIGPATSSMATEVIGMINEHKDVIVFSPTVSSKFFSGKDDNFIRFGNPNTKDKILNLAQHVKLNVPNVKRALMIYDTTNASYADKWSKDFSEAMQNISVSTDLLAIDASKDYFNELQKYIDSHESYDVVAMALNGKTVANVSQKLRIMSSKAHFYAGGWALSEDLFITGGASIEGLTVLTPFNPISNKPDFLAFKKAYQERFGKEPGSFATRTYDVVMFVKEALSKNQNISKLKETFLDIGTFKGLQNDISVDKFGDPKGISDLLLTIKGGDFVQTNP